MRNIYKKKKQQQKITKWWAGGGGGVGEEGLQYKRKKDYKTRAKWKSLMQL